jgi:hypothetical protein
MRRTTMLLLILLPALLLSSSLWAQWPSQKNPGIPRTADGKPDLSAKVRRAAEGKPDRSGVWTLNDQKYLV